MGSVFELSNLLKKHMKTHVDVRDSDVPQDVCICDICGKMFHFRAYLDWHLLIHSGEKTFLCDTCGKSFTLKDHLRTHVKSRSDE